MRLSGKMTHGRHPFQGERITQNVRNAFKVAMRADACLFAAIYGAMTPALTGNVREQINRAISAAGGAGDLSTQRTGRGSPAGPTNDANKRYKGAFEVYPGIAVSSRPEWADVEMSNRPDDGFAFLDISFRGGGKWMKASFVFGIEIEYWEQWEYQYHLFDTVAAAYTPRSDALWGKTVGAVERYLDTAFLGFDPDDIPAEVELDIEDVVEYEDEMPF